MKGRISSFETLGSVDGPGVRFVVFMQGCYLKCGYCHNPETWELGDGKEIDSDDLFEKIKKYKPYFGNSGGVTFSGGEPLLQGEFVNEVIKLCKKENIHTAIDTSGSDSTPSSIEAVRNADLIILDIKMNNDDMYQKYIGYSLDKVMRFLSILEEEKKEVWIRQVIIPFINDDDKSIHALHRLIKDFKCIKKVELLPFRKLCKGKYQRLGIQFRFGNFPETTDEKIKELEEVLRDAQSIEI